MVEPLGFIGGFLDAAGGGGWGPIVTSNLLVQGVHPRKVIGTVNTAEFFLSVTISATFIVTLGAETFTTAMVGLLIGGLAAAPLGGFAAKRIPARALLVMVGVVLTLTSAYGIYTSLKALSLSARAHTIRRAASAGHNRHKAHIPGWSLAVNGSSPVSQLAAAARKLRGGERR